MTDIAKSRELFNWLKRDTDCWHEWEQVDMRFVCMVLDCDKETPNPNWCPNPDFFSPPSEEQAAINFFWLWDRIKEQENWRDFTCSMRAYDWWLSIMGCEALAEALHSYFEGQKGQDAKDN